VGQPLDRKILEREAFRRSLRSQRLVILVLILLIEGTVFLTVYWRTFATDDRRVFFIQSVWPDSLVWVLGATLMGVMAHVRRRIGREVYRIIEEDIRESIDCPRTRDRFLGYLLAERDNLLMGSKLERGEAVDRFIEKVRDEYRPPGI